MYTISGKEQKIIKKGERILKEGEKKKKKKRPRIP